MRMNNKTLRNRKEKLNGISSSRKGGSYSLINKLLFKNEVFRVVPMYVKWKFQNKNSA